MRFQIQSPPSRRLLPRFSSTTNVRAEKGISGRYTSFIINQKSVATYKPFRQRLFPFDQEWQRDLGKIRWPTKMLPQVIGSQRFDVLALIREYLVVSLFKACAESLASENASRLAAMQRAERNIDERWTTYAPRLTRSGKAPSTRNCSM